MNGHLVRSDLSVERMFRLAKCHSGHYGVMLTTQTGTAFFEKITHNRPMDKYAELWWALAGRRCRSKRQHWSDTQDVIGPGIGGTFYNPPFTTKTWPPVTHKIDPEIDEARHAIIEDLLFSQTLAKVGIVRRERF
jgi:hypothetical protein